MLVRTCALGAVSGGQQGRSPAPCASRPVPEGPMLLCPLLLGVQTLHAGHLEGVLLGGEWGPGSALRLAPVSLQLSPVTSFPAARAAGLLGHPRRCYRSPQQWYRCSSQLALGWPQLHPVHAGFVQKGLSGSPSPARAAAWLLSEGLRGVQDLSWAGGQWPAAQLEVGKTPTWTQPPGWGQAWGDMPLSLLCRLGAKY